MIGNTFQSLFLVGANKLASNKTEYTDIQKAQGFTKEEWDLLCSEECWTQEERLKIPALVSTAVSCTLRAAGLTPVPLPGAFVAATICRLVCPCNRYVAALAAPESFDVMSASGLTGPVEDNITTKKQMLALVTYFSSAEYGALENVALNAAAKDIIEAHQQNTLAAQKGKKTVAS